MDYVFVLDISGSMNDDGKLEMSRESLGAFIAVLGAGGPVRGDRRSTSQPTPLLRQADARPTRRRKQQANDIPSAQQARGGTVLNPAVEHRVQVRRPKIGR